MRLYWRVRWSGNETDMEVRWSGNEVEHNKHGTRWKGMRGGWDTKHSKCTRVKTKLGMSANTVG